VLTYTAKLEGGLIIGLENLTCGFTMTYIGNTYLENLENEFDTLNDTYQRLKNTFEWLNQIFWESFQMILSPENLAQLNKTYWEFQQNLSSFQGSITELGNTRRAVVILAVTTAFFVITTIYLVMRRPKQIW